MPYDHTKRSDVAPGLADVEAEYDHVASGSLRQQLGAMSYEEASQALAPVQRDRGDTDLAPQAVHEAAHQGVAGAASQLPHLSAIQASFGPHDITGTRAQVGGQAADACQAMGANAYATGHTVAFARAPDLHTAAHEAAHIVQQRAGVQLAGGVGREGDTHERHADAVADRVVSGRSASDLLGQYSAGPSTAQVQQQRVQLDKDKDKRAWKRGMTGFKDLYGANKGHGGIWSKHALHDKKNRAKVIGTRAGVVLGNLFSVGLVNLGFVPWQMAQQNTNHKRDKRRQQNRGKHRKQLEALIERVVTECGPLIEESGLDQDRVTARLKQRIQGQKRPSTWTEEEEESYAALEKELLTAIPDIGQLNKAFRRGY